MVSDKPELSAFSPPTSFGIKQKISMIYYVSIQKRFGKDCLECGWYYASSVMKAKSSS